MSVYHRTYTRMPLALDVRVQFKGEIVCQTLTRNINHFGAFIELPEPELEANDFVKIIFIDKTNKSTQVKQKGMVIHSSEEGIGILFASDTREFREMLEQKITKSTPSYQAIQ